MTEYYQLCPTGFSHERVNRVLVPRPMRMGCVDGGRFVRQVERIRHEVAGHKILIYSKSGCPHCAEVQSLSGCPHCAEHRLCLAGCPHCAEDRLCLAGCPHCAEVQSLSVWLPALCRGTESAGACSFNCIRAKQQLHTSSSVDPRSHK
jgi:hypothetical protein